MYGSQGNIEKYASSMALSTKTTLKNGGTKNSRLSEILAARSFCELDNNERNLLPYSRLLAVTKIFGNEKLREILHHIAGKFLSAIWIVMAIC